MTGVPLALSLVALAGCASESRDPSAEPARPQTAASKARSAATTATSVMPRAGGRHQGFVVTIVTRHATGDAGELRRQYIASAHAVRARSGCVNNRDRAFPNADPGTRIMATLDPARGEGGPEGWCPGRYVGTVTYTSAYACPDRGVCRPPRSVPTHSTVVGRFSFRVARRPNS